MLFLRLKCGKFQSNITQIAACRKIVGGVVLQVNTYTYTASYGHSAS